MEQFQHLQDLNIHSSCRTCLENLNDMEMYYDIFALPDLQEKLTLCSSLPVEPGDGLPTSLCESCHTKIEDFYNFQQMCLSARTRFQEYINSERKPCSMDLAIHTNNSTGFMIFTLSKSEHEEKNPISSEHVESMPSFKMQDQSSLNDEVEESEESQALYGEYNITNLKGNPNRCSSRIKTIKRTLDDMVCHKKTSAPLNRMKLECEICKQKFKKTETFEVHMRLHQGLKPFPCQLCDKSYSRQCRLKLHIKAKHETKHDGNLPCTELGCNIILSNKQTLREHIRDIHWKNGKKPKQRYICEECGKVQSSLDALKKHRYLHTGQQMPHECPQCHKRFLSKNTLKEHINRHDGIKNYSCSHCGAKKTTRRDLEKHVNSHTKERKYPCQYCNMVYYTLYNVNRHKRIVHEGIKDFACSYCDKSFGRAETRKHHEMTHTGERPHECSICHKKFIQFVSLKKHRKVHLKGLRKDK